MRKKIFALLSLVTFCALPLFAQEMPENIRTELEAKAKALNPGNPSGEKAWLSRQKMAWESLANTTYSLIAEDIALIKKLAQEKHPLDFAQQETFINDQVDKFKQLSDYELVLGADFKDFKKAAFEKFDNDINKILRHFEEQCMAKSEINNLSVPDGVDVDMFNIVKDGLAAKMKGDYVGQLNAIKKQFFKGAVASEEEEVAITQNEGALPTGVSGLINNSKEMFLKSTLLIENDPPSTAFAVEIQNRLVVIIPAKAYVSGSPLTILNSVGEKVEYSQDKVYVSKNLPLIMIIPDVMPTGVEPIKIAPTNEYRNKVGKNLFFVGSQGRMLYSIPTKLNSVADLVLTTSTACPGNFYEGSLFLDSERSELLGIMMSVQKSIILANWFDYQNARSFQRNFQSVTRKSSLKNLIAIRVDRLDSGWEKINDEKLAEEERIILRLTDVVNDANFFFVDKRMSSCFNLKAMGPFFKKNYDELKVRMEVARFDKMYRKFLDAYIGFLKNEIRNIDVGKTSAANRVETKQFVDTINAVISWIEQAKRTDGYKEYKEDLKAIQGIQ